jgi:hypothetical protein
MICPKHCHHYIPETDKKVCGNKLVCNYNAANKPKPLSRQECLSLVRAELSMYYWITKKSCGSSVGIPLGYGLDDRGSRVRFPEGLGIFLFTIASRTALGSTQPPIQWVPEALSRGLKRPGRETDHSPLSSAEVKNAWSYTSSPRIRLHGVVLS